MFLATAFMIGLAGSVHCVGMCGAIALSLPYPNNSKWLAVKNASLYNFGRIITYSILGAVLGLIGQGVELIGYQQQFSIGLGILLLIIALFAINVEYQLVRLPIINQSYLKLKGLLGRFLSPKNNHAASVSTFSIGLLNGLLPCGLVYMALVGAVSQVSAWEGALYMALFGLGTFPLMFATAFMGRLATAKWRKYFHQMARVALFVFAILFILRGMNLGIPYVSPKVMEAQEVICH